MSVDPYQTRQNMVSDQDLGHFPLIQQFIDTQTSIKMDLFKF